jgi:small subunit ribosomal protein S2
VAITDSNCDPDEIDHIIPGNDDAIRAVKLITSKIADSCLEARQLLSETELTTPEMTITELAIEEEEELKAPDLPEVDESEFFEEQLEGLDEQDKLK